MMKSRCSRKYVDSDVAIRSYNSVWLSTMCYCTLVQNGHLLFTQKVHYSVNLKTKQCNKTALDKEFRPVEVPLFANFTDEVYLGISGLIGAGVLENIFQGNDADKGECNTDMLYHFQFSVLAQVATLEHGQSCIAFLLPTPTSA